jgi:hypothetical protein
MTDNAQPLDLAGSTPKRRVANVVLAPMSEDVNGGESPHEYAWTNRLESIKVPAPMRENTTRNAQPLDTAWTTPKRRVANVVPAPRLGPKFASIEITYEILCWNL